MDRVQTVSIASLRYYMVLYISKLIIGWTICLCWTFIIIQPCSPQQANCLHKLCLVISGIASQLSRYHHSNGGLEVF